MTTTAVSRWRVLHNGQLVMIFPGVKASTDEEAREYAKAHLEKLWNERMVVVPVR